MISAGLTVAALKIFPPMVIILIMNKMEMDTTRTMGRMGTLYVQILSISMVAR
jgi:hypothetical protein